VFLHELPYGTHRVLGLVHVVVGDCHQICH
jgi:hypothetical protein